MSEAGWEEAVGRGEHVPSPVLSITSRQGQGLPDILKPELPILVQGLNEARETPGQTLVLE